MKIGNNKGSTIIDGLIISMILLVILGFSLGIATNYQKKSVNDHAKKQAYFNAIALLDSVAVEINNNNVSYIPTTSVITLTDIVLPSSQAGELSGEISKDANQDNIIYIEVVSIYSSQKEELRLTMQKHNDTWYKKGYSRLGENAYEEIEL